MATAIAAYRTNYDALDKSHSPPPHGVNFPENQMRIGIMSKKIVVIGGSAAGPKAAARAKRLDPKAEVTIIQKAPEMSMASCGYTYFVGGVFTNRNALLSTPYGEVRDPRTGGAGYRPLYRHRPDHGEQDQRVTKRHRAGRVQEETGPGESPLYPRCSYP